MSGSPQQVHVQSNGARIVVNGAPSEASRPDEAPLPPPPPRRPPPLPRRPPAAASGWLEGVPLKTDGISLKGWGTAALLGGLVTLLCAVAYNAIVFATYTDFRILAVLSGSAIGYAVRTGTPPGKSWTHRVFAVLLTYACGASTHTWWLYDALVHPEAHGLVDEYDDGWGDPTAPVKVDGPIQLQSLDAPSRPAMASFGVDIGAAFSALVLSAFLPVSLLAWGDPISLLFLLAALGQAWKVASPGWT